MISLRWRPSSWMQFSSLFLKSSMTRANNWRSIGRISWRMASFISFNVLGFVSVNTRFQITPKKKITRWKDRESEGATARLRNGKWGARGTCFEQWSLTCLQCALWHHLVETTHWAQFILLRRSSEYYPFKRCQVPVSHSVHVVLWYLCRTSI